MTIPRLSIVHNIVILLVEMLSFFFIVASPAESNQKAKQDEPLK